MKERGGGGGVGGEYKTGEGKLLVVIELNIRRSEVCRASQIYIGRRWGVDRLKRGQIIAVVKMSTRSDGAGRPLGMEAGSGMGYKSWRRHKSKLFNHFKKHD